MIKIMQPSFTKFNFYKNNFAHIPFILERTGMYAQLTAAMGKRTKHQQTAHAQMYLLVKSSLLQMEKKDPR